MAIAGSGIPGMTVYVRDGILRTGMITSISHDQAVPFEDAVDLLSAGEMVTVAASGGIKPLIDMLYDRGIITSRVPW